MSSMRFLIEGILSRTLPQDKKHQQGKGATLVIDQIPLTKARLIANAFVPARHLQAIFDQGGLTMAPRIGLTQASVLHPLFNTEDG